MDRVPSLVLWDSSRGESGVARRDLVIKAANTPVQHLGVCASGLASSVGAVRSAGEEEAQGPLLPLSFFWIRRGGLLQS